jgi:alpha-tubulin suppressor-like RCC1 family protein
MIMMKALRVLSRQCVGATQKRSFAVYAVGEGWTGALGKEHAQRVIKGHHDEEETDTPLLIYSGNVKQATVGWGHTCIIDSENKLKLVGRSQDFITLLRLYRLPVSLRNWAAQRIFDLRKDKSWISTLIGVATGSEDQEEMWDAARKNSQIADWTSIDIPDLSEHAQHVEANAGLSAVVSSSGTLYTFGINSRGQCGIGSATNNVWTPHAVVGLNTVKVNPAAVLEQDAPIIQVSLGLQHGLALSATGHAYSWGKAGRGQLGRAIQSDQDAVPKLIMSSNDVSQIASGMHFGTLLTHSNQVYLWGKNIAVCKDGKPADVRIPQLVQGLPPSLKVEKISCGSHHLSLLMEDGSVYALGVAADINVATVEPVLLVPSGIIDMPCRQFEAHQDRTTIIGNDGRVLQVHLWKDASLREHAVFTPPWVDHLLDEQQSIRSIHRGWLHTIIVTQDKK